MTKLKELSSIIASLNEDEVKTLQRYLHCFDTINDNHEPKSERLLNLLIHDNQMELKLFEKKFTKQAFSMLIMRLHEKVMDTLTFDINIKRIDVYSDLTVARLSVRKKINYVQVLMAKNQILEAINLHTKTLQTAKEYEFFDEALTIMYELQNLYAVLSKKVEFDALDSEIEKYEDIRTQVKSAFRIYNRITMEMGMAPEDSKLLENLENTLPKLRSFYQNSNSAQAGWFYYRLLIEFHQAKQNYAQGYSACLKLLKLQQENPSIRSEVYMGITYKLMSKFSMFLYQFDDALLASLKSQNLDKRLKRNQDLSKETEFFANFFKGDFAEARFIMQDLAERYENDENSFNYSKFNYYAACCSLLEGNTREVANRLNETKEIEKDKDGWNIAVRILSIINQIEGEDFDLADSRIESMRKHIERTLKEKEIRPRFVTILRILRDLVNSSFDFEQIWLTRQSYFEQLSSETEESQRWKILSPELIRFEVWFESKATGISYNKLLNAKFEGKRLETELLKAV
ncbi:MAG: hypothetical protein MH137_00865 [Flavobacteriales bacterium]|nr:hypothetical protein [Flavobacteriales bacterium]